MTHLLPEGCTEGLEVRFQKPDVAAHDTEVGNLFSLYPEIDGLEAYAQVDGCIPDGERNFFAHEFRCRCASSRDAVLKEVPCVHAYL